MSSDPTILVRLNGTCVGKGIPEGDKFDWNKVLIGDPVTNKSKDGAHEWVTSSVHYCPDGFEPNKKKYKMYFQLAKQNIWGISGTWPIDIKDEKLKTIHNIDGYQVCYPMTSLKTVKNPTKEELYTMSVFDGMWTKTLEKGKAFAEADKLLGAANNSYLGAKGKEKIARKNGGDVNEAWKNFIKPSYSWPLTKDLVEANRKPNKEKPQNAYIEFVTRELKDETGKITGLKCETQVYDEKEKRVDPKQYFSTFEQSCPGDAHIAILWMHVYWGSHGSKKCWGGSNKLKVSELHFRPTPRSTISSEQMLNIEVEENSEDGENNEHNSSFISPANGGQNDDDFKPAKSDDAQNVKELMEDEETENTPKPKTSTKKPSTKKKHG